MVMVMGVSPEDHAERLDPWTSLSRKWTVAPPPRSERPAPLPTKETTPQAVQRRERAAAMRALKLEAEQRRLDAVERFKAERGVLRLPPKPEMSAVLRDLTENPPQSISECLDRHWKQERP